MFCIEGQGPDGSLWKENRAFIVERGNGTKVQGNHTGQEHRIHYTPAACANRLYFHLLQQRMGRNRERNVEKGVLCRQLFQCYGNSRREKLGLPDSGIGDVDDFYLTMWD